MADERRAILELELRFFEAANSGEIDEFEFFYTEDAILMMPDRPAYSGREAVVAHYREFLNSIKLRIEASVAEVAIHGAIGYCRGTFDYSMEPKMGGEAVTFQGKFIDLFKKDELGEWKFWRNIYNTDAPMDS